MPRLNLKMPYGEVSFDFTDNEDLTRQLEKIDFEAVAKIVAEKVGAILPGTKQVREDIKDLVDTDGKFMIFKKTPRKKIDKVMLAIYAYGTSATTDEIRRTTGILDPSGDVINAGSSRKYFITITKQTYGLSDLGIQTVTTEIIPSLLDTKGEEVSKGKGSQ